jgi:type II secretory pathway component GspD/PulD (secretin)
MLRFALVALLLAGCHSPQSSSGPVASAGAGNTSAPVAALNEVQVIPLKNAEANQLAAVIRDVFGQRGAFVEGSSAPGVFADTRTNSLIVRAGAEGMARIRDLVAKLDVHVEKPAP